MALLRRPFVNGDTLIEARAKVAEANASSDASTYRRNVFVTPRLDLTNTRLANIGQQFSVAGDHIYIASIDGPGCIQMKLGTSNNCWIDVDEGMTLIRQFDQVEVRDVQDFQATTAETTVCTFYTSFGTFIDRPFKIQGLRPGFITQNFTVTTTPVSIRSIVGTGFMTDLYTHAIYIQNVDGANKLGIVWAPEGSAPINAAYGFEISPGVILPLQFDGKISFVNTQVVGQPDIQQSLHLFTRVGTCAAQILMNYRANYTDSTMEAANNRAPLQIET